MAEKVGLLVSALFLRQVVLCTLNRLFFNSIFNVSYHINRQSTAIQKLWGEFNLIRSGHDIQQRPRSGVATRGHDH